MRTQNAIITYASMFAILVVLTGCPEIKSVRHQRSALRNDTISVAVTIHMDTVRKGGSFYVQVPDDWSVIDGRLDVYEESIQIDFDSLWHCEGCGGGCIKYWGGGVDSLVVLDSGLVSGVFRMVTGGELGVFDINYKLGGVFWSADESSSEIEIVESLLAPIRPTRAENNLITWMSPQLMEGSYSFNIYRDNELIANYVKDTFFIDPMPLEGIHKYEIATNFYGRIEEKSTVPVYLTVFDDVYVSPYGSDQNSGTRADPFRSLSHTMSLIASDSLHAKNIYLESGIYASNSTGEVFPIHMKDYVSVFGDPENETVLDGNYSSELLIAEGVTFDLSNLSLVRGASRNNAAALTVGGIWMYEEEEYRHSNMRLSNVQVMYNQSYSSAIEVYDGMIQMYNVTIAHNTSGISINSASGKILNSTIVDNYTSGMQISMWNDTDDLSIENCIIRGNDAFDGDSYDEASLNVNYSNIENLQLEGIGNIDEDPQFAAGSLLYLLSPISPCIDAGHPGSQYYDNLVTGLSLAQYPSMGMARNDIGAYGGPDVVFKNIQYTTSLNLDLIILGDLELTVKENTSYTTMYFDTFVPVEWSISGSDSELFDFAAYTRFARARFKISPDFEFPKDHDQDNIYEFSLTAKNAQGVEVTKKVRLIVTNEYESGEPVVLDVVKNNSSDFALYPNPARDYLKLSGMRDTDIQQFQLIDLNGKVVIDKNQDFHANEFSLRGIGAGIYVARIFTHNNSFQKKVVITR